MGDSLRFLFLGGPGLEFLFSYSLGSFGAPLSFSHCQLLSQKLTHALQRKGAPKITHLSEFPFSLDFDSVILYYFLSRMLSKTCFVFVVLSAETTALP